MDVTLQQQRKVGTQQFPPLVYMISLPSDPISRPPSLPGTYSQWTTGLAADLLVGLTAGIIYEKWTIDSMKEVGINSCWSCEEECIATQPLPVGKPTQKTHRAVHGFLRIRMALGLCITCT